MTSSQESVAAKDPTWQRLEDQIAWYDQRSISHHRAYKYTKTAQLVVGSAVPIVALTAVNQAVTAALAAVVVVLEGVQQLNQWQRLWVQYRGTAEALKHEQYSYLARTGAYAGRNRTRFLSERVEEIIAQEQSRWAAATKHAQVEHPSQSGSATVEDEDESDDSPGLTLA